MTVPSHHARIWPARRRVLFIFHALRIIRSSTFRLRGTCLAFAILFSCLHPWINPAADAMSLEALRAAQEQELTQLREEFHQKALAAQGNKEQIERLNKQYSERLETTRQKYLGTDQRGLQIKDIEAQYKGEIKNSGSTPKDVRADVDLAAKSHQAASDLANQWRKSGDVVQELPDGMGYVNKTRDMTLWNPCETVACREAKIKYHDAFGTEGGRAGTGVPGAVEDPRGWFLDNQKKFTHAVGEGDLKTAAKSLDKAAEVAGIKDPNDPFWKQSERLRNYGDPVQAGIADLTDTPEQQQAKVKEWMRQATNRLDTAGEKLPQRTTFDDPEAKTRVKEGNIKTDVENIRSRGGMESHGPSEERIRKGLSAGEGVDAPGKGGVIKGVAAGVVTGVVIGAAVSYIICMEEVGNHAACMEAAKEAMSGEAIKQEVFWGAVAACCPPVGASLAAAYGAYHGVKQIGRLGEEVSAGVKDYHDRQQAKQAREAQQQANCGRVKETVKKLETQIDGELAALRARVATAEADAKGAAKSASTAATDAVNLSRELDGLMSQIKQASAACKDAERVRQRITDSAADAVKNAELAEGMFTGADAMVDACQSKDELNAAKDAFEAAKKLAAAAASNYKKASAGNDALMMILAQAKDARAARNQAAVITDKIAEKMDSAKEFAATARWVREQTEKIVTDVKTRKAAMLTQVWIALGSVSLDCGEAAERVRPLVGRLAGEESAVTAPASANDADREVKRAEATKSSAWAVWHRLEALPLCERLSPVNEAVEKAARAIANLGLGGMGEGFAGKAATCSAGLTPGQAPATTAGGGKPPGDPTLNRFSVSCVPSQIKVRQSSSCKATGEYSTRPGVNVDLTYLATWGPGPTIIGDWPGSWFAKASYGGKSATDTVTVIADDKGPPPDITGAASAGTKFGEQQPGGQPPKPTSGALGDGPVAPQSESYAGTPGAGQSVGGQPLLPGPLPPGAGMSPGGGATGGAGEWSGTCTFKKGEGGASALNFSIARDGVVTGSLRVGGNSMRLDGRLTGKTIKMQGTLGRGEDPMTVELTGRVNSATEAGGEASIKGIDLGQSVAGAVAGALGGLTGGAGPSETKPQQGAKPPQQKYTTGTWRANKR